MLSDWSKLILMEKTEIVIAWVKRINSLGGSYASANKLELSDLCNEFLDGFSEALDRGDFFKLRMFVEKLSRLQNARGFSLSEVQRAHYTFYEVIKPLIEKQQGRGRFEAGILEKINAVLLDVLFELSEAYYKQLNEKIGACLGTIEGANLKLRELSINDELTGCYNQRYFHNRLDIELSRSKRYQRPLSIIIFDVDHLKKYNDEFGMTFGDDLLRAIGEIMRKSIRNCDTAFRCGAEEFSVIFPETESKQALVIAERIRKKVGDAGVKVRGRSLAVTLSGGAASLDEKSLSRDDLIANAHRALDAAKQNGANHISLYER